MTFVEMGEKLREERLRRSMSIEEVADLLKLSPRLLRGIEAGDESALPHTVYVRGFVRSYARLLEVELDAEFDESVHFAAEQQEGEIHPLPLGRPRSNWGLRLLVLICALGFAGYWYYHTQISGLQGSALESDASASVLLGEPTTPSGTMPPTGTQARERAGNGKTGSSVPGAPASGTSATIVPTTQPQGLASGQTAGQTLGQANGQANGLLSGQPNGQPGTQPNGQGASGGSGGAQAPRAALTFQGHPSVDGRASAQVGNLPASAPTSAPTSAPGATPGTSPYSPQAAAVLDTSPAGMAAAEEAPVKARGFSVEGLEVSVSGGTGRDAVRIGIPAGAAEVQGEKVNQLLLSGQAECWVHATADGTETREFSVRKGETFSLSFTKSLVVKLGNAGGVRMKYNGSELPAPGKDGQVLTMQFPQAAGN